VKTPHFVALTLVLSVVATFPVSAATIHVPDEEPTIQAGIDAASPGDTVLVACGTYNEHDIEMESGVCLTSETGQASCVTIDAQQEGRVFYCNGVDDLGSIVGFTITGGLADGAPPSDRGGGMYCCYSSPTITACVFSGNAADGEGGGLSCRDDSYPEISDCTFSENSAENGAGLYCADSSHASLTNCAFTSNTASGGGGAAYCAAPSSVLVFANCSFSWNSASRGGGIFFEECWGGGLTSCTLLGNTATNTGGAIHCDYYTSVHLTGCVFQENAALVSGGGVYFGLHCSSSLTSCTFSENAAPHGGGIYCDYDNSVALARSIIVFSTGGEAFFCEYGFNFPALSCCDIYGNAGGDWVGCIADQYGVNGNFSADPLFCGDLNPDEPYTLHAESPCAPEYNPECGLIGAWGIGCGLTAVEPVSWGAIKAMFQ
jgi:predicted outer membrane repeat protein